MRKLDEKREVLYVIRAMDVLMSSGIGLEATVHSISQEAMVSFLRISTI